MITAPHFDSPDGARRCRVLWLDAQIMVSLFAGMCDAGVRMTAAGMPKDAHVVGSTMESFVEKRNEHRVGLLVESASFEPVEHGRIFPDLDLSFTETRL